jgi:uncharacterized protein YerC
VQSARSASVEWCAREGRGSLDGANRSVAEVVELRDLTFDMSPRFSGENVEHTRSLAEIPAALLPPITIHRQTMTVIDGLHRARAARIRGERTIRAQFFSGTDEAAFLLAVEANKAHGLPLSLAERKEAAARLIMMFPERSDRSIAGSTGLSDKTVAKVRRSSSDHPQLNARVGADRRSRPVDGADRRRRAAQLLAREPRAPLRDIANEVGISPATVLDVRRRVARGEDPVPLGTGRTGNLGKLARPQALDRQKPAHDLHAVLQKLRNDPAFKSSEVGRDVLRWLHTHAIQREQCEALLENSPQHCLELIAVLAEIYSETWCTLAKELRNHVEHRA